MGAGRPGTFAKQIKLALAIVLCAGFCACDINTGKRPYDYPPARWVCEEPNVWFEVDEGKYCYGEITVDGKTTEIAVCFLNGNEVQIMPLDAVENANVIVDKRKLWQGYAKFSKTEMTLYEASYNELFPEDNLEITFVRQAILPENGGGTCK